jgi:hypothetical protein
MNQAASLVTQGREDAALGAVLDSYRQNQGVITPAVLFYRNRDQVSGSFRELILKRAEAAVEHRYRLRGDKLVQAEKDIDWLMDPVSGYRWPERHFTDIDLSAGGRADVKFIWELNRQKHFYPLGQALLLTEDKRYADEIITQLNSWMDQNPPGWGVNWAGPLELGIRVCAWCWAIEALRITGFLSSKLLGRCLASIDQQISLMDRYLEDYLTRNTHLAGEAVALAWAGMHFPFLRSSHAWKEKGLALLERELQRQVLPNGMHYERSVYYHNYMLDMGLSVYLLGCNNGVRFSAGWEKQLRKMHQWLFEIAPAGERLPDVNDADGGVAFLWTEEHLLGYRDRLALGAAVFHNPLWKTAASEEIDALLFHCSPEQIESYRTMKPEGAAPSFLAGEEWGIVRRDAGPLPVWWMMDYGPLGVGRAGHGHADALQVLFSAGQQQVLIDPGTFQYNASQKWRDAFRGTSAHNTLMVDSLHQAEPQGLFGWSGQADGRLMEAFELDPFAVMSARHDGYQRLEPALLHQRTVFSWQPESGIFVLGIMDHLKQEKAKEKSIEAFWHFGDKSSRWNPDERVVEYSLEHGYCARMFFPGHDEEDFEWVEGREAPPPLGWISEDYGEKHAAAVLVRRAKMKKALCQTSILVLMKENRPAPGWVFRHTADKIEGTLGNRKICIVEGHLEDAPDLRVNAALALMDRPLEAENSKTKVLLCQAQKFSLKDQIHMESPEPFSGVLVIEKEQGKLHWKPAGKSRPLIQTPYQLTSQAKGESHVEG